jgi:formamidopyrimidine-DNA glycosylase
MPELPEVETVARTLREGRHAPDGSLVAPPLLGRTIVETRVLWKREIQGLSAAAFARQTAGRRVASVGRHGKYLVIGLAEEHRAQNTENKAQKSQDTIGTHSAHRTPHASSMLIHLRMSGRLDVVPQDEAFTKHARVVWLLDEGWALRFDDARKFGRVALVDDPAQITDRLGPDALQIGAAEFAQRLRRKRGALKPILLDQRFIAGVGNIYADEALFRAGLHPKRLAQTLADEDAARLHDVIRQVLAEGIAANGASFDWVYPGGNFQDNFRVYGRTGEPCRNCGQAIVRIVVGQRSTHICLHCQPLE